MTKGFLVFGLSLLLFSNVRAENYGGTIFEQNSQRKTRLFTLEVVETVAADINEVHSVCKDLNGQVVIEEKTQFKGEDLLKFEIDQKQLQQKGVIELKEGKVFFTKISADGKSTTKDEKVGKTLVLAASFRKYIKSHFSELKEGKTLEFRYGVWDRQETVGFEVFKEKVEKDGEQDVYLLKMKPSSFLIAALVKPIFFKFNHDGSRLLEMNGRVGPKQKDGTSWKDLDAEIVYSY